MAYFIHPLPLCAVAILILNDQYLKYLFPGLVAGKLSDFAGLFFAPLFLSALFSLISNRGRFVEQLSRTQLLVSMIFVDLVFIFLKLSPGFLQAYTTVHGWLGIKIKVVQDTWDLLALVMNFATYWFAKKYFTVRST